MYTHGHRCWCSFDPYRGKRVGAPASDSFEAEDDTCSDTYDSTSSRSTFNLSIMKGKWLKHYSFGVDFANDTPSDRIVSGLVLSHPEHVLPAG